ncbi:MAG: ribonuclease III, partial [Bacteroidota bacterium]
EAILILALLLSIFYRTSVLTNKELSKLIKNILGFKPTNIRLYQLAFSHRSVAQEIIKGYKNSNERLEYLGDAVLSSVIADYLFHTYPMKGEGFLTEMRSKLVSRNNLNKLAQKMGFDKLINIELGNGNIYRSKNGDAFEAIIGAIYLDKGYKFTHKIILHRIIKCYIDIEELEKKEFNFKSVLIEYAQKEKKYLDFKVIEYSGQGYNKQYLVAVYYNDQLISKGYGYSIKEAEQSCAESACSILIPKKI